MAKLSALLPHPGEPSTVEGGRLQDMLTTLQLPFFVEVASSKRILLAGMGGGFDVFCGLPLYFALRAEGKEVFLANYSFTSLPMPTNADLTSAVVEVMPSMSIEPGEYFPELYLSRWLQAQGEPSGVYAFRKVGVQPLKVHTRH